MDKLYNIAKSLKDELMNDVNPENSLITAEELMILRKAISKLEISSNIKEKWNFINHTHDFESIVNYFYGVDSSRQYGYQHEKAAILEIFDPLLITLMDQNYSVNIKKIAPIQNLEYFEDQILDNMQKMENAYASEDFDRLTTLSKTTLEILLKRICDLNKIEYKDNIEFPALYSKSKKLLKIDPNLYTENGVTPDESLRNFTQNLNELFTKLNQIRNIYSESHGKPKKDNQFNLKKLPKHHFKLILDTTKTISNFLVSSYEYQKNIQI